MNTTRKALLFGTVIAAASMAALHAATPAAPVVKLASVVVTAKRLPVQQDVIKLDTVLVTATRQDVLAAQQEEASKQAATAFAPRS
jgi:hypothetical protein